MEQHLFLTVHHVAKQCFYCSPEQANRLHAYTTKINKYVPERSVTWSSSICGWRLISETGTGRRSDGNKVTHFICPHHTLINSCAKFFTQTATGYERPNLSPLLMAKNAGATRHRYQTVCVTNRHSLPPTVWHDSVSCNPQSLILCVCPHMTMFDERCKTCPLLRSSMKLTVTLLLSRCRVISTWTLLHIIKKRHMHPHINTGARRAESIPSAPTPLSSVNPPSSDMMPEWTWHRHLTRAKWAMNNDKGTPSPLANCPE